MVRLEVKVRAERHSASVVIVNLRNLVSQSVSKVSAVSKSARRALAICSIEQYRTCDKSCGANVCLASSFHTLDAARASTEVLFAQYK